MNSTRAQAQALRLAIVDDEPLARSRLRRLLDHVEFPPSLVVLECGTADAILSQGPGLALDAVFIDIEMPGQSGLSAIEHWQGPRPEFVLVTAHHEHALRAFDLQAMDYLTKPVSETRLRQTLSALWRRCRAVGSEGIARGPSATLTVRQQQILALAVEGLANKEIAKTLGLSHFTVRNHLPGLFRLLGVARRSDLSIAAHGPRQRDYGRDGHRPRDHRSAGS